MTAESPLRQALRIERVADAIKEFFADTPLPEKTPEAIGAQRSALAAAAISAYEAALAEDGYAIVRLDRRKQEPLSFDAVRRGDDLSVALDRIAELEAALRKHGDHTSNCDIRQYHDEDFIAKCDCGWGALATEPPDDR